MTQKKKDVLLKDLCSRLPYNVCVHIRYKTGEPCYGKLTPRDIQWFIDSKIENIKPYLRPLSSMTEEEFGFLQEHLPYDLTRIYSGKVDLIDDIHLGNSISIDDMAFLLDCLNKWYLDYRGLIPMGLALPAPEGMYDTKITCNNCEDKNYCSQSEYVKNNCY